MEKKLKIDHYKELKNGNLNNEYFVISAPSIGDTICLKLNEAKELKEYLQSVGV